MCKYMKAIHIETEQTLRNSTLHDATNTPSELGSAISEAVDRSISSENSLIKNIVGRQDISQSDALAERIYSSTPVAETVGTSVSPESSAISEAVDRSISFESSLIKNLYNFSEICSNIHVAVGS